MGVCGKARSAVMFLYKTLPALCFRKYFNVFRKKGVDKRESMVYTAFRS